MVSNTVYSSSSILQHDTRWSRGGHEVVTKWSRGGHEVVSNTVYSSSSILQRGGTCSTRISASHTTRYWRSVCVRVCERCAAVEQIRYIEDSRDRVQLVQHPATRHEVVMRWSRGHEVVTRWCRTPCTVRRTSCNTT